MARPHAKQSLYFHPPKELGLGTPAIRFRMVQATEGLLLTLEADVLAKDVYLSLDGARFSDNFFDLLPGRPLTVQVETEHGGRDRPKPS